MSQVSNAWLCGLMRADDTIVELVGKKLLHYYFQDDCDDASNWGGMAYINPFAVPGQLRIQLPSSPPPGIEAYTDFMTFDCDDYSIITFSVPSVQGPYFEWRFGIRTATDDYWLTDWNPSGAGTYEFNIPTETGLGGDISAQMVFALRYNGGYPPDFSTWMMLDYFYISTDADAVTDEIIVAEPYDRPTLLETTPAIVVVRPESELPDTVGSQLGMVDATVYVEARSWTKQTVHDLKSRILAVLGDQHGPLSDGAQVRRVRYDWGRDPYLNQDGKTWESQMRFVINFG